MLPRDGMPHAIGVECSPRGDALQHRRCLVKQHDQVQFMCLRPRRRIVSRSRLCGFGCLVTLRQWTRKKKNDFITVETGRPDPTMPSPRTHHPVPCLASSTLTSSPPTPSQRLKNIKEASCGGCSTQDSNASFGKEGYGDSRQSQVTDPGSVYDTGVEYLGHESYWVFGCGGGAVRTWRLGMLPLVGVGDMIASHLTGEGMLV